MHRRLIVAVLLAWRMRRWRSVTTDPPPLGVQVLGLCDYTGVRSVTARREGPAARRWDHWHINHPTHWDHIPDALPLAAEPPAAPPIIEQTR